MTHSHDLVTETTQAWAKCDVCAEILWTRISSHPQRCGCSCGTLRLDDAEIIGTRDETFLQADMEVILQREASAALAANE